MVRKRKRVSQNKLWKAAWFYRKEAEKCYQAKAYFAAIVVRGCELEALLRIFDFVETVKPKDRCKDLYSLINRAFAKHWIPHDALRYWRRNERTPLKTCLHDIREVRNGVHAHLFQRDVMTRRAVTNVGYVVESMSSFLEIKNARNFMKHLHKSGKISDEEYRTWKKKQIAID